ncbi:head GIN domain-containing protein [Mangrovibacterium lignilyticum]|uniref:head GIN domain-containing protein n=1 Tax=Mangrovibacterium lignilyticum TaxID=2668052 RepID=UPI0013D8A238|nr:head GIN domain-containing protein [Mangrovibacterium lignilyticum]
MKRTVQLTSFVLFLLLFQACFLLGPSVKGDGHVTRQTRQLSGFAELDVSNGLKVVLIPDSNEYVVVEADENLHHHIETEVRGETLKVYSESRIIWAKEKTVLVHFRKLTAINSSSGSKISSESPVHTKQMKLRASSGSQQHLQVDTNQLDGKCSSGAHIYLSGASDEATIKASSGAHFKANEFSTNSCDADVSSGAHIWVDVRHKLHAEASSGGHVYYSGEPSETTINSSSGGSVSRN